MATVEQLVTDANVIAARMALYDANARFALEDGDQKARLVEARRIELLRLRLEGPHVDVERSVVRAVVVEGAASPKSAAEERRHRVLIGQSRLVVEG